MNLVYFFLGSVRVSADYKNITPLLNMCMYCAIPYSDFSADADKVSLCFRLSEYKKMKREADARGISYTTENKSGLPFILGRYKSRLGLISGIVLAAVIVFASHQFIWDIEVVGNEKMTSNEIVGVLEKYGFSHGSYIPSVNTDKIENRILIDSDSIAWLSINIVGTVARVEVRERTAAESNIVSPKPANLVAKKSGIIEEVRVMRGNVVVSSGKYVEKGDLLVSGLFDSVHEGFRYTRAAGEVYARTVEEFYIEIPYEYEGKTYTGEGYSNKYLNFFDFSMNISKKSGNEGAFYDKISIVEEYSVFGLIETPFSLYTERYLEYETVSMTRTQSEAEELAYFSLEERLAAMAEDTILIKKTVTPLIREDRFILHCVIVLIENIARTQEFEVEIAEK